MLEEKGIALVSILIFLLIFSLLAWSILSRTELQLRMSRYINHASSLFYTAEQALDTGECALNAQPSSQLCLFQAPLKPAPWVTTYYACSLKTTPIASYYVIEKLPTYTPVCAIGNDKTQGAAEYYRVTAWASYQDNLPIVLQSTYVLVGIAPCVKGVASVKAGRLSWRELDANFTN
jgi:Tfp pilus assembly protein PilX